MRVLTLDYYLSGDKVLVGQVCKERGGDMTGGFSPIPMTNTERQDLEGWGTGR